MKPFAATATRPPWLNPHRLRQPAVVLGALLALYAVLVLIALLGGPRIGAPFLPLPGGGPDPANPVAGLQPTQSTTDGPTVPRDSETPAPPATATPTPLPSATTGTTDGPATYPPAANTPTPELAGETTTTFPPATHTPPAPNTSTHPTSTTTATSNPTTPQPPTSTQPTSPPTTPDDPEQPDPPGGLGGFLGHLFDKLGGL
ncbi:hypothetical protein EV646_10372 [Kribbella antiqua]|uniref:Uncharacterized protein n=1 Tax=Kribbella antiqua TaxID=2512217 RepID=A0A4R2IUN6_9ACTN|nr:hypothetical protein [Kribbella antiqua]TCO49094.1 hypothetical protein EV646_10372 [Kribbella antiqua]